MSTVVRLRTSGLMALFVALPLWGHPGHDHAAPLVGAGASLVAGVLHPLTGVDHLFAMVALGVWSALTTRRVWLAPLGFAVMLMVGAVLGLVGVPLPAIEPMIAASLFVLGLLIAVRARLPEMAGIIVAGVFAMFHGAAHGGELPAGASALPYMVGFLLSTVALHGAGIGAGLAMRHARIWLIRLLGGGVALYGAFLLST